MTMNDSNIPLIYPFCGKYCNHIHTELINILTSLFISNNLNNKKIYDTRTNINYIIKNMLNSPLAVIKNKKTGIRYVNKSKRNSYRTTFGTDIVNKISPLIIEGIKETASKLLIPPEDIIIDKSHGDIIYYESDCFFSEHRDQVNKYPEEIKHQNQKTWRMYSLILCIDSNIITEEGATVIHLPSRSWILNNKNYNANKRMMNHIFTQSCKPYNYLIFPSEALHASTYINKGYKLALKLDLWLKLPFLNSSEIKMYSEITQTHECLCELCYTRHKRVTKAVCSIRHILEMDNHILYIIGEYGDDKFLKRDECICPLDYEPHLPCNCQCTCNNCLIVNEEYQPGILDEYPSSDGECNGYCD